MKNMDFENILIIIGLSIIAGLLIAMIAIALTSSSRSREYELRCIDSKGIYLRSQGQDFCIKEFMPLKDNEK